MARVTRVHHQMAKGMCGWRSGEDCSEVYYVVVDDPGTMPIMMMLLFKATCWSRVFQWQLPEKLVSPLSIPRLAAVAVTLQFNPTNHVHREWFTSASASGVKPTSSRSL